MAEDSDSDGAGGAPKRGWLRRHRWSLGISGIGIGGAIGGILAFTALNLAMDATNTLEFCISCHEMESTVYQEYTQTVHFQNASGVRATCADCHVPRPWFEKVVRKVYATNELYHHFIGTIDTQEKFEAHRLEMAKRVWASMEASDSQECRNCHSYEAMDFAHQSSEAAAAMTVAFADGETCISCHKGIAHELPDMASGFRATFEDLMAESGGRRPDQGQMIHTLTMLPIYAATADADPEGRGDGRLLPHSAVTVLDADGDWLQVEITGWLEERKDQIINAAPGARIFTATLGRDLVEAVERGETVVDNMTDIGWTEARLVAWMPARAFVTEAAELEALGSEMYTASCASCHASPDVEHYTANQWIGTLKSMKRFTTLGDDEYYFLQKYLQFHAKDMIEGDDHG